MNDSKIDELLSQFADKTQFALELAARDANIYGLGFVSVDRDGNVVYLDYEEVLDRAKFIKEHDAVKRNR